MKVSTSVGIIALFACVSVQGQTLLRVDASAPAPVPISGHVHMGTATAPGGHAIGINNQYLTRDGRPWLPVMGEFHYSRVPEARWLAELQKMKSAGVDVVSTYVIWNHHEEHEGRFDWNGNRDLRRFVQLCAKADLDVVVRLGPWVHAEARYGGIPDWVVNAMPTRTDDPLYLHYVERLFSQTGKQLSGLLWKDGGRVIAVQLENEYNLHGPGQGEEHVRTLKRLALKAGLDVPLYTATAWDGAVYPPGEFVPMFGGYPDEPWATSTTELPPKETYAFRFDNRVSGDLGAQTAATAPGTAELEMDKTPFLSAEFGAGLPAMYRRRTLVSPDDIASMLPVQLGSGLNMMGYYMFQGGRNPVGGTTLEENTMIGGYNDTPMISYDFNAPLGPDGQQRPVLARLRPFHYFMKYFGERLAPMTVRKPEKIPASPADLDTPRFSVRANGSSAFVFFNNHVRQYPMKDRHALQFDVSLPGQRLVFPSKPVDIGNGAYFIWPINFDLDGIRLVYATAQPVARLELKDKVVYVFGATQGVNPEMAFQADAAPMLRASTGKMTQSDGRVVMHDLQPGTGAALTFKRPNARPVVVMVLSPEQLQQLAIGTFGGKQRLVLTTQEAFFDDGRLALSTTGDPEFRFAVFPAFDTLPHATSPLKSAGMDGLFQVLRSSVAPREITPTVQRLRDSRPMPAPIRGGAANAAVQPMPESFGNAAAWTVSIPAERIRTADAALLEIDFVGDIGRVFAGTRMLDDWYYNGQLWQMDLKPFADRLDKPLTLSILPLRSDAAIYLPREHRPDFKGQSQIAEIRSIRIKPVYRLVVDVK